MIKLSQSWKDLERTAAKKLGGTRLVRGENFSESMLDIEHEWLACDAKYRTELATVTWYEKLVGDNKKLYPGENKIPVLIIKKKGMRGELIVISLDDFIKVVNGEEYKIESK
jgi:hypothetical protein